MHASLEDRLLRFLAKEDDDEERSFRELHVLPPAERILQGECIGGARFVRAHGGASEERWFEFAIDENVAKFRAGDALSVGDGLDPTVALPMAYGSYDPITGVLRLQRDPFRRNVELTFDVGETYVIDRRALGLRGRLRDVVAGAFADPTLRAVLEGEHKPEHDAERTARGLEHLGAVQRDDGVTLNEAQLRAGAAAIGTEGVALVQGPPGTGKTRLLAEVIAALCSKGCRVALSAFTHRAVDNALVAIRRCAPDLPLAKLGAQSRSSDAKALRAARVINAHPTRGELPERGVVAGTSFQFAKLPDSTMFHFTVFDEAGQMPIPHALAGMLRSSRWVFFGDHRQLPPVVVADHADRESAVSIFEHLHRFYGSVLLDITYRMNDAVCRAVSDAFYDGLVRPDDVTAKRRLSPSTSALIEVPGESDVVGELLDPETPIVWARVDHSRPGMRSPEEANLAAALVERLVTSHGVPASEIAVVAPFRAQVRALRSAIEARLPDVAGLTIDTVERIQGQEREVVVVSLAVGDPDTLRGRSNFFFSANRMNVALSRARTKAVLIASPQVFTALPMDPESLAVASTFKRLVAALPHVDATACSADGAAELGPTSPVEVSS